MTDYMEQDAERLIQTLESCAVDPMSNGYAEVSKRLLVAAACSLRTLLAHIQRGAVPDGWQVVPINHTPEMRAAWDGAPDSEDDDMAFHFGYRAMLAVARDHFRGAAKMAPVHCTPTEHEGRIVYEHTSEPIPNADGFVLYAPAPDQFRDAAKMMSKPAEVPMPECYVTSGGRDLFSEEQMRTYGDAREAAGYAHAIKVIKRLRDSHQTATGECQSDCDFVTAWDSAIDALRGEVKP